MTHLISSLIYRAYLQIQLHSEVLGVGTSTYEFEKGVGHNTTHNRDWSDVEETINRMQEKKITKYSSLILWPLRTMLYL